MAFSFYNTRRARKFDHKPIYWDARKEELDKRVESIRKELSNSQNNEQDGDANSSCDWVEEDARERISESLYSNAQHIRRQRNMGIDKQSRTDRIIKLLLMLVALCFIFWYLYY